MSNYKLIALWLVAALQFNAALYFVSATVMGFLHVHSPWMDWGTSEIRSLIQAAGLVLGVVLGWIALRASLRRAQAAEEKLRLCSSGFVDILHEHFDAWKLTPAERDVALFLTKGLSTREIAGLRGTSEGTVKAQTNAIYRKADVAGRPQLLGLFIEDLLDDALLPAHGTKEDTGAVAAAAADQRVSSSMSKSLSTAGAGNNSRARLGLTRSTTATSV